MSGRIIAFGDIHGCYKELQKLLDKLQVTSDDFIWSVGDAFDRAGKSNAFEVYKIFKEYKINYLYGNHDGELAYKVKSNTEIQKPWYSDWWNSFDSSAKEWFLASEKYYHIDEERKVILVHAGVDPFLPIEKTDPRILCTIQCINFNKKITPYERAKGSWSNRGSFFWYNYLPETNLYEGYTIVYGHTGIKVDNSIIEFHKGDKSWRAIGIDYGACRGELLGAFSCYDNPYKKSNTGCWQNFAIDTVQSEKNYFKENYKKGKEK